MHVPGGYLDILDAYYEDGKLVVRGSYEEDLEGKSIQLDVRQNHLYNPDYADPGETVFNTPKATFNFAGDSIPV